MRLLIVAIATLLALSSLPVEAGKHHHHRHHRQHHEPDQFVSEIVVLDQASAAWSAAIAETVEDFNLLGVPHMPRLIYQRVGGVGCDSVRICSGAIGPYFGLSYMAFDEIRLTDEYDWQDTALPTWRENIVCHELMHELSEVPDAYNTAPESCVHGRTDDPTAYDAALLAQHWSIQYDAFSAFSHEHKKDRKHKRGRHR